MMYSIQFLDNITHVKYHGADHELTESKKRKIEQASSSSNNRNAKGRKSDRSAKVSQPFLGYYKPHVLVVEIKTEYRSKNKPGFKKVRTKMKNRRHCIKKRNEERKVLLFWVFLWRVEIVCCFILLLPLVISTQS